MYLQCCVYQASSDLLAKERHAIAFHLFSGLFYIHSKFENRFCLGFFMFLVHSHLSQSNLPTNRQNNFVIKYVECEHLRRMQKQFSDLRTSAGWRSNLKGCSSNGTERKIMRKIMRKERTMNRWSRTMKWERGRIIPISIRVYSHACHQVCVKRCWAGNGWAGVTCPPILSLYASLLLDSALREGVKCAVTCV